MQVISIEYFIFTHYYDTASNPVLIPPNSGELESGTSKQITMAKKTIHVQGAEIKLLVEKDSDFISLTDLTQNFEGGSGLIEKWLRNRNTVEFLGMWVSLNRNRGVNLTGIHS